MQRPKRVVLQPNKRFSGSRFSLHEFKPQRPVAPIEIVTRRREDAVYFGRGHKPRILTISLPRVRGFFEAAADGGQMKGQRP